MACVSFTLDPELLEAARLEAARRKISLDELISNSLANFVQPLKPVEEKSQAEREENRRKLFELMYSSPLGDLGKLPTRDEIYEERATWPRS